MVKDPRAPQGAHRIKPVNLPAPAAVQLNEAGLPAGQIQASWRIDDEWWRDQPVSRLYYTVLLENGHLLTVFRDLLTGQWYEQRY
jgi:hypothetical protein